MDSPFTLFVDDAPGLLHAIKDRLAAIGCKTVEIVSTIDEAFEALASKRFSRVVGDWKMSGAGGLVFLRKVREQYPQMRCTLLTGFTKSLDRQERVSLESLGIDIVDKEELSTRWLARVVGYHIPPSQDEEFEDDPVSNEDTDEGVAPIQVSGPADIIAEQRLKIEALEREGIARDRVIKAIAQDLVAELEGLDSSDKKGVIIGSRSGMTVDDIVREIRMLTPLGLRIIELDRAARRRLIKPR